METIFSKFTHVCDLYLNKILDRVETLICSIFSLSMLNVLQLTSMKYCCQIMLMFFLLGEVEVSRFVAHSYLGSVAILCYEVLLIKVPVDFLPLVTGDLMGLYLLHI